MTGLADSCPWPCRLVLLTALLGLAPALPLMAGRTFEVGPGQALPAIGEVPWESLQAGDTVRIHWRAEPYREKWAIAVAGTAEAPVRVMGVPGPEGQLPVVDGADATCRPALDFWGEDRAILKIGGTRSAPEVTPSHITIEGLEFRGARPPATFTSGRGQGTYRDNAAAIWVESGVSIVLRRCRLHDCSNGLMSSRQSRDLLVEACEISGNGTEVGIYQHNVYTETLGIVFQYNHLGPLRRDSFGNNLKDRSAGTVIRYNWIEGGSRLLDLVESDHAPIRDAPEYRETFVYGNVLIKRPDTANRQIVRYGGDQDDPANYRNGTLYLCHNTILTSRLGRTTLLRLSTAEDRAIVRNNILHSLSASGTLQPMSSPGSAVFGGNWCPRPFEAMLRFVRGAEGVLVDAEQIFGEDPGFIDAGRGDFRLAPGSPCIGRAAPLPEVMLTRHPITTEYVPHGGQRPRRATPPPDLGACGPP